MLNHRLVINNKLLLAFLVIPFIFFGNVDNQFVKVIDDPLHYAAKKFSTSPYLKHASWGFCVYNLETCEKEIGYYDAKSLVPASSLKLLTTCASMAELGSDFRFETKLAMLGVIDSGDVLLGDLLIIPGGDPSFGSNRFKATGFESVFYKWKTALEELGIRKISGNLLIIMEKRPEIIPGSYTWDDMGNYYGGGAGPLNFNENAIVLYFEAGKKIGDEAELVSTYPPATDIRFINEVTTGISNSGDHVIIYGSPHSSFRMLTGTIPYGRNAFPVKGSLPDPAVAAGLNFIQYLKERDIEINGVPKVTYVDNAWDRYADMKILNSHYSVKLSEILDKTNKNSINAFAESLFLYHGFLKHNIYSYEKSAESMLSFLKQMEVSIDGCRISDGSGLSRSNLITPQQLALFLRNIHSQDWFTSFKETMAVGGRSGTLHQMFKNTQAEGKVWAKSGYMHGIRSYAGYIEDSKGALYSFALIVNNYSGSPSNMRRMMEKLILSVSEANP